MEDRDRATQTTAGDERTQEERPQADAARRSQEGRGRIGRGAQVQDKTEEAHRYQEAVAYLRAYFNTEDWPVTDGMADEALAAVLNIVGQPHLRQ